MTNCRLICVVFITRSASLLVSLFHLMAGASIPDVQSDPEKAMLKLQVRLYPDSPIMSAALGLPLSLWQRERPLEEQVLQEDGGSSCALCCVLATEEPCWRGRGRTHL